MDNEEREARTVVGLKSGVSVGMILGLIGVLIAVGGLLFRLNMGQVKIETRLESMERLLSKAGSDTDSLTKRLVDHITSDEQSWRSIGSRVTVLEESGSKAAHELQNRVNDIEVRVRVIESKNK